MKYDWYVIKMYYIILKIIMNEAHTLSRKFQYKSID